SAPVKYAKRDRSGCTGSKSGPFAICAGVNRGCGSRRLAARTQSAFPSFVRRSGTWHVGAPTAPATLTKCTVAASPRAFPIAWTDRGAFHSGLPYACAVHKRRVSPCERQREQPGLERVCESRGDRQLLVRRGIGNLR